MKDEVERALALHRKGDFEQAKLLYQAMLVKHPKSADVLGLYGILLGQKGFYQEAENWLNQAVQEAPERSEWHNNLANALKHQGKYKQAIHHYHEALKLKPSNPVVLNNLGVLYAKQGKRTEAISYYQQALKLKPDYTEALYNLGSLFAEKGEIPLAIEYLKQAIQVDAGYVQAHSQLAQIFHQSGDLSQAIFHYQIQLKLMPEAAEAHDRLAAAFVNQGELKQACHHFNEALNLEPQNESFHQHIAQLYLALDDYPLALKHFMRRLELNQSEQAYYDVACAYFYQDKHTEADFYFHKVLENNACHQDTLTNLGALYLKQGHRKKASEYYRRAQKMHPSNQELSYIIKAIDQDLHDFESAPQAYVKHLFDNYAPYFDKHLTGHLAYTVPEKIAYELDQLMLEKSTLYHVLDIGCGTGLCGGLLSPWAKNLVGVDLSSNMLKVAKQKGHYHALYEMDIIQFLDAHKMTYDIVVAADVFPYIGNLFPVLQGIAHRLSGQGYLLFTLEKTHSDQDYILQSSARFAHNQHYVKKLIEQLDLTYINCHSIKARRQQHAYVESDLYVVGGKDYQVSAD